MDKYQYKIRQHLYASWWIYLFVCLCFIAGIVFGSLGVNTLSTEQVAGLKDYVNKALGLYADKIDFSLTVRQAIYKNLLNWGKIFILGLTVIGMPLVLIIVFTRGFVLGFTIVFLIQTGSYSGGVLAFLAILPPNLLSFPAYIIAAVAAINFSLYLLKGRDTARNVSITQNFFGYFGTMLTLGILFTAAALIEGYLSPFFIRLIIS